jgi:hypothetical protein
MNTTLPAATTDGSYVDWPAIFAGSVVAVAIGMLLTAFGTALGLASITLDGTDKSSTFELIMTALWLVLTMIAAYLAGGYIAGRMRRRVETSSKDELTVRDGVNGLVVWGLGTILSAMLLSNIVSLAANTAGTVVAGAGQTAGAIAQTAGTAVSGLVGGVADLAGAALPDDAKDNPVDYLSNQLLRPAQVDPATADPAQLAQQAGSIMANVYRTGEVSDEDRAYLASAVAARTSLTQADAAARVDQVITDAQAARKEAIDTVEVAKVEAQRLADEAKVTALEAARVARNAGILTAFVLAASALIAGLAAFAGAVRGGRDRDAGTTAFGLRYTG